MGKLRKRNEHLIKLIEELKILSYKKNARIWKDIAKRLSKPSKNWAEVNISRIARHAKKKETILVPGKLLGAGSIDIPLTVAAFNSSESAKKKIEKAGGKAITIQELMKANPKGSSIRIMG
ncbi:MAG: 50S ribosomal protein L18e [Methanomassiliicoccales archaeon]|nr:MAG: 50S ribosomal protein L18e [Methanomassiliicoccales archaeon]